ncbi:MAG: NAD(P)H-hydrate dehydratase [Bacilli bacterium]|jgi:hydroxyethylthiazole kinase-like uncharacterized protein yjeF|nr:NAD(P)H-hydrate dehydratase [Bacilli bacterium]
MDPKRFKEIAQSLYFHRPADSIKNDFGKTLILGGSLEYPGAVLLASQMASLSGNGYTVLAVPSSIRDVIQSRAPLTQVYDNLFDENDGFDSHQDFSRLNNDDALLFGNGLAENHNNRETLRMILTEYSKTLIIDATGLRLLAKDPEMLKYRNPSCQVILLPHLGEANALFKTSLTFRNPQDYLDAALLFAKAYGVFLLLKSSHSLLVTPTGETKEGCLLKTPCLAKAGSGDSLAGYLAGILAYGTKTVPIADLILFADEVIHQAAYLAGQEKGDGLASPLDLPCFAEKIIQEQK